MNFLGDPEFHLLPLHLALFKTEVITSTPNLK